MISEDSVSFNAVDITVLIRPNTRNSFFHPPQSLALDFLSTQTSDYNFDVPIFFKTNLNSGSSNFPTSSESRLFTESLRLRNVCVYYFFQERLNGMKYVQNKAMVGKKYELYQKHYMKQYRKFELFKLRLTTVTLSFHFFTPTPV